MRRRIRSAAIPVHRHALPQLVVDGVLVALAYFLAFWLRFAGHPWGTQIRYHDAGTVVKIGYDHRYRLLFTHTRLLAQISAQKPQLVLSVDRLTQVRLHMARPAAQLLAQAPLLQT